jgi:hypothetical protein
LLIADVNDEKRKTKSEEKQNNEDKDPNDNVVTKATVVDGKEQSVLRGGRAFSSFLLNGWE